VFPGNRRGGGPQGVITDPRKLAEEMAYPRIQDPERYVVDASSIIFPSDALRTTKVLRGPNIQPLPHLEALPETLTAEVVLNVGDNISTDTIMPAGSKVLPLRSNIQAISEFVYSQIAPEFHLECKEKGSVVVIAEKTTGRVRAASTPRWPRATWGCGPRS